MLSFQALLKKAVKYNPELNRKRVSQAFEYASKLHENQYRVSGDSYVLHILSVTNILLDLRPDEDTIVASLLHGAPGVSSWNKKEMKELFGARVYFLVNAVESLRRVKSRDENTEAENIRKLFVTMAQDIRVILIKMAHRLDSMETLTFRSGTEQKQIARETLDVYVPISARLSIYSLKGKLEDLSFRFLYPRQYEHLKADLDDYLSQRKTTMEDSVNELRQFLKSHDIEAEVEGRVKNLYSIYRKLKIKSRSTLESIYDIYAVRVILPTKLNGRKEPMNDHLYTVLGLIHNRWKPLAHRFKDYVAVPKPNGYQSLHTAVVGLSSGSSQPTEIQIRTQQMHEEAEYGIASHWLYDAVKKESRYAWERKALADNAEWFEALSVLQKSDGEDGDFIDKLKQDVFSDRIFVMTPTGEVKELPKGSTPVDFAYSVHTDLGHRCRLVKVNDMVVPLDYELKNGEVVEIVPGKKSEPKPLWLSFVKTSGAKTKIRAYFRSLDKESILRKGKDLLNEELSRMGKPHLDENLSIFREYNGRRLSLRDRVGLVEEVGNRSVEAVTLLKNVFGDRVGRARPHKPLVKTRANVSLPKGKRIGESDDQICIAGECDLPYRLAHCCNPRKGLPIVAYVTRGHSVTIHLQRCKLLRDACEDRILEATWGKDGSQQNYSVKLRLRAKDRTGLIRDIAEVITNMNINIRIFSDLEGEEDSEGVVRREVIVDVAGDDQLDEMMDRLERVRNVLEVKRAT
jgi:GTP diphosphokinase / guanosine-3',5'-bis(diphosphate) 3'-diphosphatase